MKSFVKDPDATLDYTFDWSPWLSDDVDTIDTSSWTVDSGITIVPASASVNSAGTKTTVYLSGGTAGQDYTLTNNIETVGGRIDERSVEIRVRER